MSAEPVDLAIRQRRKPAKPPARRTMDVHLAEPFAGWEARCFADFPSKLLGDLQSGQVDRIIPALDRIVVDHNFPKGDDPDQLAESIGDVDYAGLGALAEAIQDALNQLPPR